MHLTHYQSKVNNSLLLINNSSLIKKNKSVINNNLNQVRNINILATLNLSNWNKNKINKNFTLYCSSIFVYNNLILKEIDQNINSIKLSESVLSKDSLINYKKLWIIFIYNDFKSNSNFDHNYTNFIIYSDILKN